SVFHVGQHSLGREVAWLITATIILLCILVVVVGAIVSSQGDVHVGSRRYITEAEPFSEPGPLDTDTVVFGQSHRWQSQHASSQKNAPDPRRNQGTTTPPEMQDQNSSHKQSFSRGW